MLVFQLLSLVTLAAALAVFPPGSTLTPFDRAAALGCPPQHDPDGP